MKKILYLIFINCFLLIACNKNSNPTPKAPAKPLQIVISDVTTTLTIYSFSVTEQPSSDTLINIYSQLGNKTYTVNVKPGDNLKLHYFLELEGLDPAVQPVISFIYDGIPMASVTSDHGIISGDKFVTIP
ncbi:MAG TPA: hypothetical protein VG367_02060 [Mucilaginibacter sp.]|jgi:hypothetical protein|nr:hypothetical protein [Mucilaginibacter sp.]